MTSDGLPYARERFKDIVVEQVTIGYLTKGGITYSDTENMTICERKIVFDTVKSIVEARNKDSNDGTVVNKNAPIILPDIDDLI